MAESQQKLLLSLLGERLHLGHKDRERAEELFYTAYGYLEKQRGSSPSLLGQDQPSIEDVWAPCIVWLLKSIPGLLSNRQAEAGAQAASPACLPLSELLDACAISLVLFFKELPVVLNKLRPWLAEVADNAGCLETVLRLREWQETLVSLTQLANKYKDLFWHVQRSNSSNTAKQPLLRAGWLVFLVVKVQLLPGFPDLVSCLELLVCVLNLLLASNTFSEQQLQELQQQWPAAIGPSGKFNLLKALSQEAKVDFANTQALMPQIEARVRSHLQEAGFSWLPQPLPQELPHPQADRLDTCCSTCLKGLASNQQQLSELVLSLDSAYQSWYSQQGEIDEREFLLTDFGALASPRTLPGAVIHMPQTALGAHTADLHTRGAPVKAEAVNGSSRTAAAAAGAAPTAAGGAADMAVDPGQLSPLAALAAAATSEQQREQQQRGPPPQQPLPQQQSSQQQHVQKPPLVPGTFRRGGLVLQGLQSPLPVMNLGPPGPATPISQAMVSVAWLRGLTKGLSVQLPASLQQYMDAAGADAGAVLVERVTAAAAAVFLSDTAGDPTLHSGLQGLQHGLAQERQAEGIKLYWHVLETMLKAEEGRAGLAAAAALLTRWSFHKCLLACAFELVAASYRMGLLSFPAIPARLGLKPFDLSKIIAPFVKAEPTMPRELKRHMFTVEEKILESLGWAPGSSFFSHMRDATGQQQQQQQPREASAAGRAAAAAAASPGPDQAHQGHDVPMHEAGQQEQELPSLEQQQELQQEAAAAAAVDAGRGEAGGTPSAAAAADLRRRGSQALKRGSETGSGDPMDMDAANLSGSSSPALLSVAAKRHRGQDGRTTDSPQDSPAFAAPPEELPLPKSLGLPPDSNPSLMAIVVGSAVAAATASAAGSDSSAGAHAAAATAAAAAAAAASTAPHPGDPSARAVLHGYCCKVLKLAAFRLVAVSEGLDFSPMTREEVVAHVHEVLAVALYQHTHLFYSRHLDTLLLSCLYGFCKVNKLQQITFREIIAHYKRQAHAKQEVFRTVVLQQTDPQLITQSTGDIIAFYNAVFVPAMKNVLVAASRHQAPPADAPGATANGVQQASAGGPAAAAASAVPATHKPSLVETAMQLAAAQPSQQQQQQHGGQPVVVSPGSAYRALSIPGPPAGLPCNTAGGLSALPIGAGLLGDLAGSFGTHAATGFSGAAAGGSSSSSFWTSAGDSSLLPAAPEGTGVPATAGSNHPSRLSRLSRPTGAAGGTAVAAGAGAGLGGLCNNPGPHAKALLASLQPNLQPIAALGGRSRPFGMHLGDAAIDQDAAQQHDQGRLAAAAATVSAAGQSSGSTGRSSELAGSDPYSPSVAGSAQQHGGSSTGGQLSSASPAATCGISPETGGLHYHQQQQVAALRSTSSPAAGAAAGAMGSPSAGLATLLQALDTKSAGPGSPSAASAGAGAQEGTSGGGGAGVVPRAGSLVGYGPASCAQQQTAVATEL